MLNLSKQQINALIDSLPDDILNECSKYICIPPVSLLNEIEHYGKVKKVIDWLKYLSFQELLSIHSILLKNWYETYASHFIDEYENDCESVAIFIYCYNNKDQKNILINIIKKIIYKIKAASVNDLTRDIIQAHRLRMIPV
jgi:hypothetical protein